MGLFSFSSKNKQEGVAEDSGYYSRSEDDSAAAARAKSKRASSAGEPAARRGKQDKAPAVDPVLPEKKRARRRLVGAIALALAVAVGLPMLLDSEPKPLATDISIQIPSKDKAATAPLPAAASLDKHEEIVEAPKPAAAVAPAAPAAASPRDVAELKLGAARADLKAEPRAVAKVEPKPPEARRVDKSAPADKPAVKPAAEAPPDSARALAILEGKGADAPTQKFAVQVASLASAEKVAELQGKLKGAGIASFTQKVPTPSGELIRVRIGPMSHDEAEKMRVRLDKLGMKSSMVPA